MALSQKGLIMKTHTKNARLQTSTTDRRPGPVLEACQLRLVMLALLACTLSGLAAARAGIVQTEGGDPANGVNFEVWGPPPPANVEHEGLWREYPENRWSWIFEENSGVALPTGIEVDITAPGNYRYEPLTPGIVPAGTRVQSFLIHFDHDGPTHGMSAGTVTFDSEILGVMVSPGNLDSSDVLLGASVTIYPTGTEPNRGVEFDAGGGNEDTVIVSEDRRSLEFIFWVWGPPEPYGPSTDQVRILTEAGASFACNDEVFITQDSPSQVKETFLYRVDQSVWPYEFSEPLPLESPSGTPLAINNLGFNSKDGLLYGWRRDPGSREIVRIEANGTVTGLGRAGLPDEPFMAGDIAPDGTKMYFAAVSHISGGDVELYTVPLPVNPDAPPLETPPPIWGDGTAASGNDRTQNVADWAVNPADGLLYGADREGDLAVLNPTTYERTDLPIGLPGGKGYGAAWFRQGSLFLYWNSGEIFEIDLADPPSIVTSYPVDSSRRNDGAVCAE